MNKRRLRKIPILPYDVQFFNRKKWKNVSSGSYLVQAQAVYHEKRAILVLNLYQFQELRTSHKEYVLPVYRIFLSKGEPEFATQDLTDCKQGWTDMTLTGIQ